jgi:hypothetical protein
MKRIAVVAVGLCLMGNTPVGAQAPSPSLQGGTDAALLKAIHDREQAIDARDMASIERLTADDYSAVPANGTFVTRAQRLANLKGQPPPASPTRHVDEAIRVYGTSAVQRVKTAGERGVWVWTKSGTEWRVAAVQITPDGALPPPVQGSRPTGPTPSDWTPPATLSPAQAAVFAAQKQIQDAFFTGDRATYLKLSAPEHARLLPGGVLRFGAEGSTVIDGPRTRPRFEFQAIGIWDKVAIVRWKETTTSGATMLLMRVFAEEGQGWRQVATISTPAAGGTK